MTIAWPVIGQAVQVGILAGIVYALVATGFTLVFGVMRIVNFAHGQLVIVAMYVSILLYTYFAVDPYLSLLITVPLSFGIGAAIFKLIISPIMRAPHHMQLVITLGLAIVIDALLLFLFGGDVRGIFIPYATSRVGVGALRLSLPRTLAALLSIGWLGFLYVFLSRTYLGRATRALAQEPEGGRIIGINVGRINLIAFGIGTACAGLAGSAIVPFTPASPAIGFEYTLWAFMVAILAGAGSIWGTVVVGMTLGVIQSVSSLFLPGSLSLVVVFAAMVVTMLVRPSGLFGRPV